MSVRITAAFRPMCRTLPVFILNKSVFMRKLADLLRARDCNHGKYLRLLKAAFLDLGPEVFGCLFEDNLLVSLLEGLSSDDLDVLREAVYCLAHIFKNNSRSVLRHHRDLFRGLVAVHWTHPDPHVRRLLMELMAYVLRKRSPDRVHAKMAYSLLKIVWERVWTGRTLAELERGIVRCSEFMAKVLFESVRGFMNCVSLNYSKVFRNFMSGFRQLLKSLDKSVPEPIRGLFAEPIASPRNRLESMAIRELSDVASASCADICRLVLAPRLMRSLAQSVRGCVARFMVHEFSFRAKRARKSQEFQKTFDCLLFEIRKLTGSFEKEPPMAEVLKLALWGSYQDLLYFKNAHFFRNNKTIRKILNSDIMRFAQSPLHASCAQPLFAQWATSCQVAFSSAALSRASASVPEKAWDDLARSPWFPRILEETLFGRISAEEYTFVSRIVEEETKKKAPKWSVTPIENAALIACFVQALAPHLEHDLRSGNEERLLAYIWFKNLHDKQQASGSVEELRARQIYAQMSRTDHERPHLAVDSIPDVENQSLLFVWLSLLESFPTARVSRGVSEQVKSLAQRLDPVDAGEKTDSDEVRQLLHIKLQRVILQIDILGLEQSPTEKNKEHVEAALSARLACLPRSQAGVCAQERARLVHLIFELAGQFDVNLKARFEGVFTRTVHSLLAHPQRESRSKGLLMLRRSNWPFLGQSLCGLQVALHRLEACSGQAADFETSEIFSAKNPEASSYSRESLMDLLWQVQCVTQDPHDGGFGPNRPQNRNPAKATGSALKSVPGSIPAS